MSVRDTEDIVTNNQEYVQHKLEIEGSSVHWEAKVPRCRQDGLHICNGYCLSDELFLDLDEGLTLFQTQLKVFREFISVEEVKYFKSLHNRDHVIIVLKKPIELGKRLTYQTLLGSDRMKEILSFKSVDRGELFPVVLVMKKEQEVKRRIRNLFK